MIDSWYIPMGTGGCVVRLHPLLLHMWLLLAKCQTGETMGDVTKGRLSCFLLSCLWTVPLCCPRRINDDNPLFSITPGELDNDNPWVTLTSQGLQLITRTHARTQTHTQTDTHTHTQFDPRRTQGSTIMFLPHIYRST